MSVTVASIADEAFDAVASEISGVVQSATLGREVQGAYDAGTGTYTMTNATGFPQTGRVVVDGVKPIGDIFPDYVIGPSDKLVLLEGFTACQETDSLTFDSVVYTVKQVRDILGVGSLFYVVCR